MGGPSGQCAGCFHPSYRPDGLVVYRHMPASSRHDPDVSRGAERVANGTKLNDAKPAVSDLHLADEGRTLPEAFGRLRWKRPGLLPCLPQKHQHCTVFANENALVHTSAPPGRDEYRAFGTRQKWPSDFSKSCHCRFGRKPNFAEAGVHFPGDLQSVVPGLADHWILRRQWMKGAVVLNDLGASLVVLGP
jgi:hypothetical protein